MIGKCATCEKSIGVSPSRILCFDCDADMLRARDEDDVSQNAREFFIRWAAKQREKLRGVHGIRIWREYSSGSLASRKMRD
jgi:hypothetical protein